VSFRQNLIRSQNDVTSASRTLQYDHAPGLSGAILSASHISMDKGITRTGFRVGKSGSRGSIEPGDPTEQPDVVPELALKDGDGLVSPALMRVSLASRIAKIALSPVGQT